MLLNLLPVLLLACPKPPVETGPPVPPASPILPAPYATVYTAAPAPAPDPLVAYVSQGRNTDETLSGAAAALSLQVAEQGGLDQASRHWALITAGWPYEVSEVLVERSDKDQIPAAFEASVQGVAASVPIGVARSRAADQDTWVLLVGEVITPVQPFAREAQVGDRLALRPQSSAWERVEQRTLPPTGTARLGPVTYDAPGEWLVELYGLRGEERTLLIRLPVYVGEETPEDGPFLGVELDKPTGDAALRRAEAGINELRTLLGTAPLQMDPVALALAGKHARSLDEPGQVDVLAQAESAGLRDAELLVCEGEDTHGCLDQLFWSIDARPALRNPNLSLMGVHVDWTARGLRVVALVAR